MNAETMKHLADGLARLVRQHVSERLGPFQSKQDALVTVVNDLRAQVAALEAKLAEVETRTNIRRVA